MKKPLFFILNVCYTTPVLNEVFTGIFHHQ